MTQELVLDSQEIEPKVHDERESSLLSLATHELRTPLSVIKWYTEMLLDGDCGDLNEDQTKYLKTIQTSNQRAIDLIKSLLNVSRLDLGTFSISPTSVDLKVLLQQVIAESGAKITEKKIHIEESYEVSSEESSYMADVQICLIILRSLISNAVFFSKPESVIKLSLMEMKKSDMCNEKILKEDSFVVTISDFGIGIPEADKSKIFSKLFKASNVSNDDSKGSGLSLFIAREILSKVGGEIWFTSVQDVGSTFCVAFPKSGMQRKEGRTTLD